MDYPAFFLHGCWSLLKPGIHWIGGETLFLPTTPLISSGPDYLWLNFFSPVNWSYNFGNPGITAPEEGIAPGGLFLYPHGAALASCPHPSRWSIQTIHFEWAGIQLSVTSQSDPPGLIMPKGGFPFRTVFLCKGDRFCFEFLVEDPLPISSPGSG